MLRSYPCWVVSECVLLLWTSLALFSESGIKPPSSGRPGNRNLAEMIGVQWSYLISAVCSHWYCRQHDWSCEMCVKHLSNTNIWEWETCPKYNIRWNWIPKAFQSKTGLNLWPEKKKKKNNNPENIVLSYENDPILKVKIVTKEYRSLCDHYVWNKTQHAMLLRKMVSTPKLITFQ